MKIFEALVKNHYGDDFLFWRVLNINQIRIYNPERFNVEKDTMIQVFFPLQITIDDTKLS